MGHPSPSTRRARYLGEDHVARPVATRVEHGETSSKAFALPTFPRSPPSAPLPAKPEMISLRPVKEFVRNLKPGHPLRILIMGEPDDMTRSEYCSKLMGWLRLLPEETL